MEIKDRIFSFKEEYFIVFKIELKENKMILKFSINKIILYFFKFKTKLLNEIDNIDNLIYNTIEIFFKFEIKVSIISIKDN